MNEILFLRPKEDSDIVLNIIKERLERPDPLFMAVSYFTHKDIADGIIKRIEENKETKILLNANDLFRPQEIGETELKVSAAIVNIIEKLKKNMVNCCEIKTLGGDHKFSAMHHKFMISGNVDVCFGSMNFTKNSLTNNFENISIIKDVNIIKSFILEFDELRDLASELVIGYDGIRSFKCPICKEENGIDFESYGAFCTYCQAEFKITEY